MYTSIEEDRLLTAIGNQIYGSAMLVQENDCAGNSRMGIILTSATIVNREPVTWRWSYPWIHKWYSHDESIVVILTQYLTPFSSPQLQNNGFNDIIMPCHEITYRYRYESSFSVTFTQKWANSCNNFNPIRVWKYVTSCQMALQALIMRYRLAYPIILTECVPVRLWSVWVPWTSSLLWL